MFENEKDFATENVAENVETPTEQITEKTYTEAEFNAKLDEVLGKKIARKEAKIRREYEKKYGDLENVLKTGTGKQSVEDLTSAFKEFYESKGIKITKNTPEYSDKDIEILAKAEAEEYIRGGLDDVIDEVERLKEIGAENMTAKEKAVFKALAVHRQNAERANELKAIGISESEYNSKEFREFSEKFNSNTPIKDIYDIYTKTKPKKEINTMGSMKTDNSKDNGIKDFYTIEEARKFTQKDFEKNPKLYEKVVESSHKW